MTLMPFTKKADILCVAVTGAIPVAILAMTTIRLTLLRGGHPEMANQMDASAALYFGRDGSVLPLHHTGRRHADHSQPPRTAVGR